MAAFSNRIIRNITSGELLCWLLYLVFWASCNWIDALIKISLTIPLWWLYFVTLKNKRSRNKLLLHLITLPAFCLTWFVLCKLLNTSYRFSSPAWDLCLTALFYCCQFTSFHLYNHWLRSKRRKEFEHEMLEYSYQHEIMSLKTQIGPHFLFNTLNSISATVPPANEETRILISQLADTFRYALNMQERPTVPLKDEIVFVQNWLALEKQRMGNRLEVIYEIEHAALNTPVPAMILHPLLENALSNGISRQLQGGSITIRCVQEKNFFLLSITDITAGFTNPLQSMLNRSTNLSNASRRLEQLSGEPLSISYNHNGMTVSFRLPCPVPASNQPVSLPLTMWAPE